MIFRAMSWFVQRFLREDFYLKILSSFVKKHYESIDKPIFKKNIETKIYAWFVHPCPISIR